MRYSLSLAGAGLVLAAAPAGAETLREALAKAYNTNPTLTADRANVRAIDENVPIARAQGLPAANAAMQYSENVYNDANTLSNPKRQIGIQPQLSVPLYAGGGIRSSIRAAETRVDAGRLSLRDTEASVFSSVVGAYMDVIRDEAIVSLNAQNVHVLEVNLQASRDRFQVGDLTRTDVAQSEARLALARSQLQSAQAQLIASRESYIRFVGTPPGKLEEPPALPNLPADPEVAVDVALKDNPALLAAQKSRDATVYDVGTAAAARLPRVSAIASGNYFNYFDSLGSGTQFGLTQTGKSATVGVQLNLPLYQGGGPTALIRQAQARRGQAIEQVTEVERNVIAQARSAYAIWKSSLQVIASSEAAVNANKLSLEGVRAENSVGSRTILDILNAEQELLNSQITLVSAQRDAYVAGFSLLAAMGKAEARDLGLDGGALYDPVVNYKRVSHTIWDYAPAPAPKPVATRTTATPPQTAIVTKPLDPFLDTPVDSPATNPTDSAVRKR
ncbi:TolC family outer membrane protein [Sphingomonas sp. H39-1-10]|uniref:TolC family outer membrane protein n=1 Tax=Sphingomonas pollutisoli TaxID=3030829 RepID=UPI0023B9C230|nr:TolC family outer membrane protein [Sphingomonas pollutisoli]MDF0487274.1 TolC family outer membrane protein [Sphingomonas pollutisoli]